jgi:hypothetical protein
MELIPGWIGTVAEHPRLRPQEAPPGSLVAALGPHPLPEQVSHEASDARVLLGSLHPSPPQDVLVGRNCQIRHEFDATNIGVSQVACPSPRECSQREGGAFRCIVDRLPNSSAPAACWRRFSRSRRPCPRAPGPLRLAALIDVHSRRTPAKKPFVGQPSSEETAALLREAVSRHGRPRHFVSDKGGQFTGDAFAAALAEILNGSPRPSAKPAPRGRIGEAAEPLGIVIHVALPGERRLPYLERAA